MKKIISIALALVALITLTPASNAQVPNKVFAGTGTAISTTNSYYIAPAYSLNGGPPVLTYLNATSDKTTSKVYFYTSTNGVISTVTNSTTTLIVGTNTAIAAADIIVIRHVLSDTYERAVVASTNNATNIVVATAPSAAVIPGDYIYKQYRAGSIPCGSNTLSLLGTGIYAGKQNLPLLLEVDGTSACSVNAVSGFYQP